jgi:hypothetical protein
MAACRERGLEDVPDDLWHGALQPLLNPPDVLSARLASRRLRSAASKAISRLLAVNGRLPGEAWQVFSAAVGVVVRLLDTSDTSDTRRALQSLADELPGRLLRIDLQREPARQAARLQHTNAPHALITALGAFLRKAPQRPWAAGLQQLRISNELEVTPAVARAALAGLPSLQELQISVRADDAGGSSRSAALAQFPPALEALVLRGCWDVSVDAAGLAATCPGLRKLQLLIPGSRGLVNAGSLGSLTQLQQLELDVRHIRDEEPTSVTAEEQVLLQALLLAAIQLPHLHTLKAPGAAVGPEEWQLLAGMPALQQALLGRLGSLGAAALPVAGLVQLEVEDLQLESWEAGAVAALLPQLEELEIRNGTMSLLRLCTALQGHSRLRRLLHWPHFGDDDGHAFDYEPEATWPEAQPLQSMPQLQSVNISDRWYRNMDGLLADAAGCAALQELDVRFGWDFYDEEMEGEQAPEPFWATARGLAALAAGPCASTLRKLQLGHSNIHYDPQAVVRMPALSPAEVALLLRGAFPQLQELAVEVRLGEACGRLTGSGGGSAASDGSSGAVAEVSEAQVDACLARAAGAAGSDAPRWNAVEGLVRALLQQGVQGLAGFGLVPGRCGDDHSKYTRGDVEGSAGRCKVLFNIWPRCECEW